MTTALTLPYLPAPFSGENAASVLRDVQSTSSLSLFCCTWNMHGKAAPEEDVKLLFPKERYHLLAIGTEECEKTIAKSIIFPSKERWERQLAAAVGSSYVPIGSSTLGAIHLMVFAHQSLKNVISDVQTASVPCGFANTIGNKGGVGVAFNVGGTSFLIINSHLAAFQQNVAARNANYRRIEAALPLVPALFGLETKLRITREAEHQLAVAKKDADAAVAVVAEAVATSKPVLADEEEGEQEASIASGVSKKADGLVGSLPSSSPSPSTPSSASAASSSKPIPKEAWGSGTGSSTRKVTSPAGTAAAGSLLLTPDTAVSRRYHRVVFMGDLNYRVNCSREEADEALKKKDLAWLLARDQLAAEKSSHHALIGFEEGPIAFLPTYKLDKGTDDYDSSEKKRIPAWTDRILYRASADILHPPPPSPSPSPLPSPSSAPSADGDSASDSAFTRASMTLHFYEALTALKHSDHRPVAAGFTVKLQGAVCSSAGSPSVEAGAAAAAPSSTASTPAAATPSVPAAPGVGSSSSSAVDDWPKRTGSKKPNAKKDSALMRLCSCFDGSGRSNGKVVPASTIATSGSGSSGSSNSSNASAAAETAPSAAQATGAAK